MERGGLRPPRSDVDSIVLAILNLLAQDASAREFEALIAQASGAESVDPSVLNEARRLALHISDQLDRHRRREADVAALVDTAREFAGLADVDSLLKMIARRARLLLGVDMSYISFPDESGDDRTIYIRTADGHTSVLSVGLRLPGSAGVGNKVVVSSAPFWTADYLNDPRIQHSKAIDDVIAAEGLHAVLAVPLSYGPKPFGALYAASRTVRQFTADEVSLMSSLGDLAGVAIERAILQEHTDGVIKELQERQIATEATAASMHSFGRTLSRILELAAGGADLTAVVTEAHRHLGGALRLCAANGDVLIALGEMPDDQDALTAVMVRVQSAHEPMSVPSGLWAMPLRSGNRPFGALLVLPGRELGDAEWSLMLVTAHAATTYLLLENLTSDVEDQSRDELLDDLLTQPQRSPQQLVKRALRMGVDLTQPHVVLVVRPKSDSLGKIDVWASSYSHRRGGLKTLHRGCAVLLVPDRDAEAAVRAAFDSASGSLREELTVSASGPVEDAASVFHGHREAVRCMEAMTALGLTNHASSVRELGFLGILLSDHHDVDGFVKVAIGPILDYDQLRSTELTRTLEAYFAEGGSPTYAAKQLHVHPNTVTRRLERITGLLGPNWQQPSQALEVQLALRLHRVRSVLGDPGTGAPTDDQLA